LPVVILDPDLGVTAKIAAFVAPTVIHMVVGNVLEPLVFGSSMELHPVTVLLALAIWYSIWGIPGAILAVPITAVMRIVFSAIDHPYARIATNALEGRLSAATAEFQEATSVGEGAVALTAAAGGVYLPVSTRAARGSGSGASDLEHAAGHSPQSGVSGDFDLNATGSGPAGGGGRGPTTAAIYIPGPEALLSGHQPHTHSQSTPLASASVSRLGGAGAGGAAPSQRSSRGGSERSGASAGGSGGAGIGLQWLEGGAGGGAVTGALTSERRASARMQDFIGSGAWAVEDSDLSTDDDTQPGLVVSAAGGRGAGRGAQGRAQSAPAHSLGVPPAHAGAPAAPGERFPPLEESAGTHSSGSGSGFGSTASAGPASHNASGFTLSRQGTHLPGSGGGSTGGAGGPHTADAERCRSPPVDSPGGPSSRQSPSEGSSSAVRQGTATKQTLSARHGAAAAGGVGSSGMGVGGVGASAASGSGNSKGPHLRRGSGSDLGVISAHDAVSLAERKRS
jgi:AI-2 transport protein TqsA